jgi:hypothetical protein
VVIDLTGVFFAAPPPVSTPGDAGVAIADAGSPTASSDAGAASDAGAPSSPAPATDGGSLPSDLEPEVGGCGCNSVELFPLVALGLALLRRRG